MSFQPTVKKRITLPHFKLDKAPQYHRLESAMVQGEHVPGSNKEAPFLIQVTNLETGEIGQIIAPAILQKELHKHYPDHSYVGRCFQLSITPPVEGGKKYNLVNITEIEDPAATVAETKAKK